MHIEQLKEQFANPPSEFALAPFWFLNHELTDAELKWQINEMNNNGVRGFVLHARHGLITEYLSNEWFDRIETCIKEAHRLGMKVYLYDEDNWPSGPVSGELLKKYPEYRQSGLTASQRFQVSEGSSISESIDVGDGLVAVVAVPVADGVLLGLPQSALLLDAFVEDGVLDWSAPDDSGDWMVFVFTRIIMRGRTFFDGYLDTLNKDAVDKFIEMTHKRYTERFSKYFGSVVDGMFTDEPTMHTFEDSQTPFTPTLPSEFRWRHDYDYYRALPAMFADAGEVTAQLRCDVNDTLVHLYQQAFFKNIYDYCESNRLNLIGHVLYEGELHQSIRHQGDFFRGAEYMHWGGCDQLTDTTWPKPGVNGLNNLVGPKLASSAAHLFQKPRVMSECFGVAYGWKVSLRMLKRLADWLVAQGVNMLIPHAFYYSIQGQRKWECPPGEFYQSSFWPYYRYFADYAARLCSITTGAQHVADVAVVFPARSMWSSLSPDATEESNTVVKDFELVTTALRRAGLDFDIIPEEELIGEMSSFDLSHIASGERYKAIVIPHSTALLSVTAEFIVDCIDNDQNIILAGDAPTQFVLSGEAEWNDHDWSADLFAEQFGRQYDLDTKMLISRDVMEGGESAVMIPGVTDMSVDQLTEVFLDMAGSLFDPDVIIEDQDRQPITDIIHYHYVHGEHDFFFLVNTSSEVGYSTHISLDTIGMPSIWNAETGEVLAVNSYDYDGDRTLIDLDFQPGESYVLAVTTVPVSDSAIELDVEPAYSKVMELADEWEFTIDKPNALPFTHWHMETGQRGGFTGVNIYTTEFECEAELHIARLLVDGMVNEKIWHGSAPSNVSIILNGQKVQGFSEGEYLDHQIFEQDVLGLIKRGTNTIEIHTATQLAPSANLSNPVYLVGDFELRDRGGELIIVPPSPTIHTGDWAAQGYPYYSGTGVYRQVVTLPRATKNVFFRMDAPGDMAEVFVNGQFAAVLPWEPWAADITDLVKSGKNEIIIKVTNSMANMLLVEPNASGILGKVEIAITK
ncbi:MAG: glycosyl hydrolase [Armatimonadota bacterium]|nr:hypothetical protein [bacterium]